MEGTFDNTNSDTWHAVIVLLRNAFIQALEPSIDAEISIASVNKMMNEDKRKKK